MGDLQTLAGKAVDYIPFISSMAPGIRTADTRPVITRLVEQGILAFGAAFFTLQISDTKQTEKLMALERRVEEMRLEMRAISDTNARIMVLQAQMVDVYRRLETEEQRHGKSAP